MSKSSNALPDNFVAGNHFDKYRSGNPIHRKLMSRFLACVGELTEMAKPKSIIEAGCGPGDLAHAILENIPDKPRYVGSDICDAQISIAKRLLPASEFLVASIDDLPFEDESCDLAVACEVLEHVENPSIAVRELSRITSKWALISVPWEPTWRCLNLLRGKYISNWGNTPGHIQHFSKTAIRKLVSNEFEVAAERHPLPWTMLLLRKRVS